jgi:hypothetical protein
MADSILYPNREKYIENLAFPSIKWKVGGFISSPESVRDGQSQTMDSVRPTYETRKPRCNIHQREQLRINILFYLERLKIVCYYCMLPRALDTHMFCDIPRTWRHEVEIRNSPVSSNITCHYEVPIFIASLMTMLIKCARKLEPLQP